jgi:hypothetical protein
MKARVHIVTIAVAAAAVIGTQAAEAHMLAGTGGAGTARTASSNSVLSVMTDAGIRYHAAEILRSEKHVAGGMSNAETSKSHVRIDPRIMELKRRFP